MCTDRPVSCPTEWKSWTPAGGGGVGATAEKRRIVEESYRGDRQASVTARRHWISTTLLYRWRRDAREGVLSAGEQPPSFILATVVDTPTTDRSQNQPETAGRMEIALSNGRRVMVDADVDGEALRRVLTVADE